MKPLQQYFHMVLFVLNVVLAFKSLDKILRCEYPYDTSSAVLSHATIWFAIYSSTSNFRICRDEIFWFPFKWNNIIFKVLENLEFFCLSKYFIRLLQRDYCFSWFNGRKTLTQSCCIFFSWRKFWRKRWTRYTVLNFRCELCYSCCSYISSF